MKTLSRVLIASAIIATGMTVTAPANAAGSLTASIACEPTTALHVLCISTVSGGTGPYTRNWFYNNRYFPSQDNKITTGWSCTTTGPNTYSLAVIDANFQLVFASTSSGCNSGNW